MLEMETLQSQTATSNPIYAKNDGNGPPSADQDLSTVEPRHGHVVCTLRVHPPTSPCPALSADAEPFSQGHCRKSHDEDESIMTTFGVLGPKGLNAGSRYTCFNSSSFGALGSVASFVVVTTVVKV